MILAMAVGMMLTQDTVSLRDAMHEAVQHVVSDTRQGIRSTTIRTVYVDVASFRHAAGLGDDVPTDWSGVASIADVQSRVAASRDVWGCDPTISDRGSCHPPAQGSMLVRAHSIAQAGDSLVAMITTHVARSASRSTMRLYTVVFRKVGGRYVFDHMTLDMV
ncbi:MAG: hypothetical protein ACREL5_10705 [Gemmatimonadales bacterium]